MQNDKHDILILMQILQFHFIIQYLIEQVVSLKINKSKPYTIPIIVIIIISLMKNMYIFFFIIIEWS